ncbi:anaphase-promoting complex component [Pseudozyma hubeiensis SY62]|uniref:Anaphase-promoting complex subunit 4 n=1 Tax=Pseudozyma hubeiensis (strain SY62) TaxID=1305764 RepID=R9P9E7_PSEHS|nr:anaphase-promoting complex component [Pseudozyma hubeiensis SY62]GAC94715.1 anaphase-promoting complex component [Pseudozyma hubeiensis SY62]
MPVSLVDGSVVGDGSQIGMFPVLADQRLDKPATLLRSSANPRMDLVLLIVKDAAAQSTPAAAAPPGMSAAQFALVQRMLAARQRGAQAGGAQGQPEPKRGPQIHLVLWRMGDDSSVVWSSSLTFDKLMDLAPDLPGASQQEHEDVHLHDVAWSPKGDRIAALASVKRSPVTSTSTATSRITTFLRTYSVQDGRLLSTIPVRSDNGTLSNQADHDFAESKSLSWLDVDFGLANDVIDGSSESLLAKLPPLPLLPAADTFASAGGSGNLMPHQLRMMQMSGQKPPPSFQYPSHIALQGRGPLERIPRLAKADADLRLVEGGEMSLALDSDLAWPLSPETVVLVSSPNSASTNLILDGQIEIGSLQLSQIVKQEQKTGSLASSSCAVLLSRDMMRATAMSTTSDSGISHHQLELPLPVTSTYGPLDARRKLSAVSRASHLLRFYLGYALDTASALQQVYQKEFVQKVTSEWTKNIDDLSIKFGGDMKYELINVLLTGRAGPAAEQFLLGNLTEGVLTRLEQQTLTATYTLKKLISESLKPALERCIVCLTCLVGQAQFFGESEEELTQALDFLQLSLDSTLSLAEDVDLEALISQEFYRWCRTERERQERIKQDQDEPRLPITYDVHYVAGYIDRGFENEDLQARLGNDVSSDAFHHGFAPQRSTGTLQDTLKEAMAFLAAPRVRNLKAKSQHELSDKDKKAALAIVPTLIKAIEILGGRVTQLLRANLDQATVERTGSCPAARQGWSMAFEPAPALSISSTANIEALTSRTCTSVVHDEMMLSAHILRSDSEQSSPREPILVVRQSLASDCDATVYAQLSVSSAEEISILDIGFYGDAELLVLATLPSPSVGVLLAFDLADLPFTNDRSGPIATVTPARATEFESDFKPGRLAVNTNKQTVAVIEEEAKRIMYLDISVVELADMAMNEDA